MANVDQPLSDTEYARIAIMLERSRSKGTMNLEVLDGFFAALICSPDLVPPSQYLREIWGDMQEHPLQRGFFLLRGGQPQQGIGMRRWQARWKIRDGICGRRPVRRHVQ